MLTAKGRAQTRADPHLQSDAIRRAIRFLQAARDELKLADCPRTLAKVRSAIKSAGGAERHAANAWARTERQALKITRSTQRLRLGDEMVNVKVTYVGYDKDKT